MTRMKRNHRRAFPSIWEDFFGDDWFNPQTVSSASVPSVNVKEGAEAFELEVAAPGMAKEDFKLHLDKNVLTISSEKEAKNEEKDEGGTYRRREFSYSSFKRSFTLPESVDITKIGASYVDGILRVNMPKKEEAKEMEPKLIAIS